MKLSGIVVVSLVLAGCQGALGVDGAGGGGGAGGGSAGANELPCDVAALLSDSCLSCHGSAGPQVGLQTRAELAAMSPAFPTMSMGQRAVLRMRATSGVMPPAPASPVAGARIDAFEAWVNAGMVAGSCQASSDAGTPDAGPITPYDGGLAGLPCDVSAFVGSKCASCHGAPLAGGATFPLLSRADFLATSSAYPGVTQGARSSLRVHDAASPMPPAGSPTSSAAELTAFDAWVSAGMPAGTCGTVDPPDAGPAPTTCASNSLWLSGNSESPDMNPGLACLACHSTRAWIKAYPFSGTVFPARHEKDRCNAPPPSGGKVEIIDRNGNVVITMYPSATSGNFHSPRFPLPVAMPYTARVTVGTRTATMTTPQTSGDCNACHTEQGTNGALGRIVWP